MSPALRSLAGGATLALAATTASAQVFSGVDAFGGVGGPRGNSDAAHAAWLAAAGPISHLQTFEGIAIGTAAPMALGGGMVLSTAGAAAPGGGAFLNQVTNDQDDEIGYNTTPGGERFYRFSPDFGAPATMTITFGAPTYAFGMYITGIQQWAGLTTASWDGSSFLLPDSDPGATQVAGVQFFGVVSAVPIASVSFETRTVGGFRDIMGFDDIEISAVPEPSTVALLVGGLLALGGVAARRRG